MRGSGAGRLRVEIPPGRRRAGAPAQHSDQPPPSPSEEEEDRLDPHAWSESSATRCRAVTPPPPPGRAPVPLWSRTDPPDPDRFPGTTPFPPPRRTPPVRKCSRTVAPGPTPTSASRTPKSKDRSSSPKGSLGCAAVAGEAILTPRSRVHTGRGGKTSQRSISYPAANAVASLLSSLAANKYRSATVLHAATPTLTPRPELKIRRRLWRTKPRPFIASLPESPHQVFPPTAPFWESAVPFWEPAVPFWEPAVPFWEPAVPFWESAVPFWESAVPFW
eukprot:scaffold17915_cov76-Isochrysis_galbana.AAC.1